jgi:hypothetical protein
MGADDTLPRGAVGAARAILDRVVSFARSRLPRKSEPPPEPSPASPEDPIRTRSMAHVLEDQGELDRALAIVEELCRAHPSDRDLVVWRDALFVRIAERAIRERATARLAGDQGPFVEIIAGTNGRGVVWRVDEAGLSKARALLGARGVLTLRVVRVIAHPDHSVESRQEDRRPLEASGWARLDVASSARLVVSVGLSEGERFVSVSHAAG